MTKLMKVLRWVLVVPVAVLGAIVSTLVLHLIIMMSCGKGQENMVDLGQDGRDSLERTLTGAVMTFSFIFYGAKTAPSHQVPTATGLAGLMIALHLGGRAVLPKYFPGIDAWGWMPLVLSIASIIGGIVAVAKSDQPEDSLELDNSKASSSLVDGDA